MLIRPNLTFTPRLFDLSSTQELFEMCPPAAFAALERVVLTRTTRPQRK